MEFDTRREQQSEIRFNPKAIPPEDLEKLVEDVALRGTQTEILVRNRRPDGTVDLLAISREDIARINAVFGRKRRLRLGLLSLVLRSGNEVIITPSPEPASSNNL